jgi:pyridoxal 5'-phosphate synthase pdxS subunit
MRHARLLQAEMEVVKQSKNLKNIAKGMVEKFFVLDDEAKGNLGEPTDFNPFGKDRATIESEVVEISEDIKRLGRLPVVTFTAGGIATPADAALMMQFGMDGVFVGSGIFKSEDPTTMAKAIVEATAHYDDAKLVGDVSRNLGESMPGLEESRLETKMAKRGH